MNETKRRINEYKLSLPKLRERLIAVALLLSMSASMLTTVTFAWLALSTNPEVSGANTSITSNGNLEIALAWNDESPFESKVGDSNLPDYERNNTWGNLVNLAISDYGLNNLVLRPALLNTFGLIDRPLYGPVYDANGRVIDMNTNFGYAKWETDMQRFTSTTDSVFANSLFGVRAITSMKYGEAGANADAVKYNEKLNAIEALNSKVQTNFNTIVNIKEHQDALSSLMTGYMIENQLKTNPSHGDKFPDASIQKSDLTKCLSMYEAFIAVFEEEASVVAQLLSLQAEVNNVNGSDGGHLSIDGQSLLALDANISAKTAKNTLIGMGFKAASKGFIENIDQFIVNYNTLISDHIRLQQLIASFGNSTSILWKNSMKCEDGTTILIDDIVNNLVNVKQCTIVTEDGAFSGTIGSVGLSAAMDLNGKKCMTTINNGILYNFHSFCGGGMQTNDYLTLQVTVKYGITINGKIYSKVKTSSTNNYFDVERANVEKLISTNFGQPPLIANDTYGFALDLWVRTNAAHTFLTLQGNVLTETKQEPVKGKDANGNEVDIYTITIKIDTGEDEGGVLGGLGATQTYDVYKNGDKWYLAENHAEVTAESLGLEEGATIPTPIQKIVDVEYVVGYEGDNRVWNGDEHYMLSVNSTTQGSGSCYVFYAETPTDQQRSLEVLKSMKVAFVDDKGNLLATAYMDSDHHYADSGKVIVPLVLDSNTSLSIGNDVNGDAMYAITALEQNVATRITAIVYLDGTNLTDDDVLASADIEGKINIQFGSSVALHPIDNEELYNAELIASVDSLSPNEFDYDTLKAGEHMTTNVKIRVIGTQPKIMTANFIRQINATQGSPEKTFTLTDDDGDGIWEGNYDFLYPGTYILRSVTMDGVERDLQVENAGQYAKVIVKGFTITSVSQLSKNFVMTDATSHSEDLTITFASNDPAKMPKSVLGKFIREDGATVNVNFTYDPTTSTWKGKANFVSSGTYSMQYVVLDGQYVELSPSQQRNIELILGMRVVVETDSPTTLIYGDPSTPETLQIRAQILDNNGAVIPNLANADLYYAMGGTNQLHTKLTWDSAQAYYYGEFKTEAGTWHFNRVVVSLGENINTLTRVNSNAPVFTIIPPTPPTFVSTSSPSKAWLLSSSQQAIVTATLKDATSAKVIAKLRNVNGEIKYAVPRPQLEGGDYYTIGDTQNFQFAVDDDGLWTVEAISVFNVFDEDRTLHTFPEEGVADEETFMTGVVFSTDDNAVTIAVLSEKNIKVTYSYSGVYDESEKTLAVGKDLNGVITSSFMQNAYINDGAITISFSDSFGLIRDGYFNISDDVSLSYKYDTFAEKYGGYTITSGGPIQGVDVGTFSFTRIGDTAQFTLSNNTAVPFQYAAKYTANKLSFNVTSKYGTLGESSQANPNKSRNVTSDKTSEVYPIEVWSITPWAKVSSISSQTNIKVTWDEKKDGDIGLRCKGTRPEFKLANPDSLKNIISDDGYNATIYASAKKSETQTAGAQHDASFDQPTLSFRVYGVDNSSKVTLTLPRIDIVDNNNEITKTITVDAVTFTTDVGGVETTKGALGKVTAFKTWSHTGLIGTKYTHTYSAYYGHGTQTITTMTIERQGVTFTVFLDEDKQITIINPSSDNSGK